MNVTHGVYVRLLTRLIIIVTMLCAFMSPVQARVWTEKNTLTASDGTVYDWFGQTLDLDTGSAVGDFLIVGTNQEMISEGAYIFKREGEAWVEQVKLLNSDTSFYDWFGAAVAIDAGYAVVGARGADPESAQYEVNGGAAYVFSYDGSQWAEQAILTASDGYMYDGLGNAVAIDGTRIIVGASQDEEDSTVFGDHEGSAYIFVLQEGNWVEQGKLVPNDPHTNDFFGHSVDIDGNTAIVGTYATYETNSTGLGAAYIFVWNSTTSTWTQQAKLTPSDIGFRDYFGGTVSIHGDYALIGASNHSIAGRDGQGAAYVFKRTGGAWAQQAILTAADGLADDHFGTSVSLEGTVAVIGAPYADNRPGDNSGAVYIFERTVSSWAQIEKKVASDNDVDDQLGRVVALSGNYFATGAEGYYEIDEGKAYVFDHSDFGMGGTVFTDVSDLAGSGLAGATVSVSNGTQTWQATTDSTGQWRISPVETGTYAVSVAQSGYRFEQVSGGVPNGQTSVSVNVNDTNDGVNQTLQFLGHVELTQYTLTTQVSDVLGDGSILPPSATYGPGTVVTLVADPNKGYRIDSGSWRGTDNDESTANTNTVTMDEDRTVTVAFYPTYYDLTTTVISGHGTLVASESNPIQADDVVTLTAMPDSQYRIKRWTGTNDDTSQSASNTVTLLTDQTVTVEFELATDGRADWPELGKLAPNDGQENDEVGYAVGLSGDFQIVGAPGDDDNGYGAGAAYLYQRDEGDPNGWRQHLKLYPSDADANDMFGNSVGIHGDYAIVGAQLKSAGGVFASGRAYIFHWNGSVWQQQQSLVPADPDLADLFGSSVAIGYSATTDTEFAIVGAVLDDDLGTDCGSAYIFQRQGSTWVQQAKLTAADGAAGDNFGTWVALDGDYAIVGSPYDDDSDPNSGSAYLFHRQGTTWTQQAKLIPPAGSEEDNFGRRVAISDPYVVVSSDNDDDQGIDQETDNGAVYVYQRYGNIWAAQDKLLPTDLDGGNSFGASVALDGDYLAVGAMGEEFLTGAAYVFWNNGTDWVQESKLTASDGATYDIYGCAIDVDNGYVAVGARWQDGRASDSGSIYTYQIQSSPASSGYVMGGTVFTDVNSPTGSGLANVEIEIRNPAEPGVVRFAQTDAKGQWQYTSTSLGTTYSVNGSLAGYQFQTVVGGSLLGQTSVTVIPTLFNRTSSQNIMLVGVPIGSAYTLAASVTGTHGSVIPTSGLYAPNTQVTLTATPDTHYRVKAWSGSDDDSSTAATNTVIMEGHKNVTVEFEGVAYTLTTRVVNGNGTLSPVTGPQTYGTAVNLTAIPDAGYRVKTWSGTDDDSATTHANTITMAGDETVTVEFEPIPPNQYTLTASVVGGNGIVSPTSGTYDDGTVVNLTATPNSGYQVASWSGTDDEPSTATIQTVTMDKDETVIVTFEEIPAAQYTLNASVPNGHGTISPTGGTYDRNVLLTLTATSDTGYRVKAWFGTNNTTTTATANSVTMHEDKTVTVEFEVIQYNYSGSVVGGHGTLTPGSGTYDYGTVISLTAAPETHYQVKSWSGSDDDTATHATHVVTVTGDVSVNVTFEEIRFALTGSVSGGHGTLLPNSGTYQEGQSVSVTATPDQHYRVKSWSGTDDDSATTATNTVTMTGNETVIVEFEAIMFTLTGSVAEGQGTLTPLSGSYLEGTSVDLIATPNAGYEVASWTDTDDDSFTGMTNHVTLNSETTVSVTFVRSSYELVTRVSGGQGTLNPPQGTFYRDTVVDLIATPQAGYQVKSWSGTDNDSVTATTNTVTMDADQTVNVVFELAPTNKLSLDVAVIGGHGEVNPVRGLYDPGERVVLTALPDPGYAIKQWTGTDDDTILSTTNTVIVDANIIVTVEFQVIPTGKMVLNTLIPGGHGSLTPTGGLYDVNTVVNLTAGPDGGYQIESWTGSDDDTSTATANTIVMTSDKTVTVSFVSQAPEVVKITASDGTSDDAFGQDVKLYDGLLVVGAPEKDVAGASNVGAVYVFEYGEGGWTQQAILMASDPAENARFGETLAVSDQTMVVGSPNTNIDDDTGLGTGTAYIFQNVNDVWTEQAGLTASDGIAGDRFGCAVAIYGDLALVGAESHNSDIGAVYLFRREGSNWVAYDKLEPPVVNDSYDGNESCKFGSSISLVGDELWIGSEGDGDQFRYPGRIFTYRYVAGVWTLQQTLLEPELGNQAMFGRAVSLTENYAIGGALRTHNDEMFSGAACLFQRDGSDWVRQVKLIPETQNFDQYFGWAVAITETAVVVGAPGEGYAAQAPYTDKKGAVYLYQRGDSTSSGVRRLASPDASAGQTFGQAVAIQRDHVAVGAPGDADDRGAVYVYRLQTDANLFDVGGLVFTDPNDPAGSGLEDVEITVGHDNATWQTTSDANGLWLLENIGQGIYSVSLNKVGSQFYFVDPNMNATPTPITITVDEANRDENEAIIVAGLPTTWFELAVHVIGGHGTVEPNNAPYLVNRQVDLTATPENGYQVKAWSGTDNDASKNNINSVTMESHKTVIVEFEVKSQSLLHDWNGDGIRSIIGDVPGFVNAVYFNQYPDGWSQEQRLAVGDGNGDGILSIIGDVPPFVDCVYFGNCE